MTASWLRIQEWAGARADGVPGPATARAIMAKAGIAPLAAAAARMRTSKAGIDLIHSFEGLRLDAYPDPGTGGKPWTIGWGATSDEAGRPIEPGTRWPRRRADDRFLQHLAHFESAVNRLTGSAPTTQAQFDALVSFAYNVGEDIDADLVAEGLGDSTLLKKHLTGDHAGAAMEFAKWNKAGDKVMAGLTRRRAAEAAMYRGAGS